MNEEEKEFFETRIPILRRHYVLLSEFNGQVNEEETKKLFTYIRQLRKENRKLQQERNNYKELYEKEQEKTDKAYSWITLMLMDNDVSKEKALITIKNVLSNEMEGKTIL